MKVITKKYLILGSLLNILGVSMLIFGPALNLFADLPCTFMPWETSPNPIIRFQGILIGYIPFFYYFFALLIIIVGGGIYRGVWRWNRDHPEE